MCPSLPPRRATAAQLHLKVDTEEELSGTFKAEDGTVMHFRSTPGQVQLADEDMQEILDTEQYDEDFLEHSDAVKAVIKNANEYQVALDQEGPLAEQFVHGHPHQKGGLSHAVAGQHHAQIAGSQAPVKPLLEQSQRASDV